MRQICKYILSLVFALSLSISPIVAGEYGNNELVVEYGGNKLTIEHAAENSTVIVSNMLGVRVFVGKINNSRRDDFSLDLKKGFYIVKIGYEVKRIVVK